MNKDLAKRKNPEERLAYISEWKKRNREKCYSHHKKWYDKVGKQYFGQDAIKERNRIRGRSRSAVEKGIIKIKGCKVCGGIAQIHHPDYNDYMNVEWLCYQHHLELHQILRESSHISN